LEGNRQIWPRKEKVTLLLMILVIVLLLALFGSLPSWPHSRNWGYYPSGGISLILLILLILFLMGRL
jgi:Ca2+/Na+ antiporter